jgi:hypothetical protein
MSFADLKRNRQKMFEKLNKQIENENSGGRQKDERIWYPDVDQAGNGYAEIRFLPAPGDEPCPYVKVYSHGFKGPGGWYIENSLTTIGKQDFVGEENQRLWNVEDPVARATHRALIRGDARRKIPGRKRNLSYFANIYIVSDPANPENNGQVRLFRFGQKIYDKLQEAMQPDPLDPDAKQINPFDLFGPDPKTGAPGGANFKIKIRKNNEGFRSYEKSTFGEPAPLFDDDDKMEEVWKKAHSLQELIAPDKFKSYDELKARYLRVVGGNRSSEPTNGPDQSEPEPTPRRSVEQKPSGASEKAPWEDDDDVTPSTSDDDDEDGLDYFKSIADSDD